MRTAVFWISYLCWVIGHFAYVAATPNQLLSATNPRGIDIPWSMGLTGEAGYIVALLAGLVFGNFFPGVVTYLKEAALVAALRSILTEYRQFIAYAPNL